MSIRRQRLHRRHRPAGALRQDLPDHQSGHRPASWPESPPATRPTSTSPSARRREAFEDGRWRSGAPAERKACCIDFAKLIERNRHELAVLESLDSGKPVAECQTVDVPETINTIRWHAELIDKIYDSTAPVGQAPWPWSCASRSASSAACCRGTSRCSMMAWKIGPALAAGCSVIVKPAEETSLTALRVAELAFEAGIPAGVLNVVTGTGPDVGEPIGLHHGIDMVSFTGSTETGQALPALRRRLEPEAGRARMRRQEPGRRVRRRRGPRPRRRAGRHGAFWNMGENCSATSRLIVHAKVKDELLDRIKAYMREWRMGDPLDPEQPGRRARQPRPLREGQVLHRQDLGREARARRGRQDAKAPSSSRPSWTA